MKKFVEEFKAFIMRGNVLDMAVGVIVGGAFGKITTSLVNDVFMPFISWLVGARDMTALNVVVREPVMDGETVVKEGITLGFGSFVSTVIDFVLVAFVVFLVVKLFNKAHELAEKKKKEEEAAAAAAAPAAPEVPAGPTQEELLAEIRDLLKKQAK